MYIMAGFPNLRHRFHMYLSCENQRVVFNSQNLSFILKGHPSDLVWHFKKVRRLAGDGFKKRIVKIETANRDILTF